MAKTPAEAPTSHGLKMDLYDEFKKCRNGEVTPQQARASASLANGILAFTRLEMDYARFVSDQRRLNKGEVESAALVPIQL